MRVAIKITKSWRPGTYKLLRTKLQKELPVELTKQVADRLTQEMKDDIIANTNSSGKLAKTIRAVVTGTGNITIPLEPKYAKYVNDGIVPKGKNGKDSYQPIERIMGNHRGWVDNPAYFVKVTPSKAKGFFDRSVERVRPMVPELASELVNKVIKEVGL